MATSLKKLELCDMEIFFKDSKVFKFKDNWAYVTISKCSEKFTRDRKWNSEKHVENVEFAT